MERLVAGELTSLVFRCDHASMNEGLSVLLICSRRFSQLTAVFFTVSFHSLGLFPVDLLPASPSSRPQFAVMANRLPQIAVYKPFSLIFWLDLA